MQFAQSQENLSKFFYALSLRNILVRQRKSNNIFNQFFFKSNARKNVLKPVKENQIFLIKTSKDNIIK